MQSRAQISNLWTSCYITIINIDFKAPTSIFSPSLKTNKQTKNRHLYFVEHKIKDYTLMAQWDAKLEIPDRCPGSASIHIVSTCGDMCQGPQAV